MNEFPFGSSRASRIAFYFVGPLAVVAGFSMFGVQSRFFLLIPYFSLVLARSRPFPSLHGSPEGTELMLFLGTSRRAMEREYLREVIVNSLLHAAAFTLAWRFSGYEQSGFFDLRGPYLDLKVFSFFLSIQLVGRTIILLILNAPMATCLPRRLRGFWNGNEDTALFILVSLAGGFVLLTLPPFLAWQLGSPHAVAIPAVAYFAALALLVPTTEFSGVARSWRPQWISRRSIPIPVAASRYRPLVGLWWRGLSRWVWAVFALCVTPAAVIALIHIFWPSAVAAEEPMLPHAIWYGLAAWTFILLMFGGKALRWSASGDSEAALYLAGVAPSTLRRVRLLSSGVIVAIAALLVLFAALDLPDLGPLDRGMFGSGEARFQFIALACAGHLLLNTNESFVFFRRGKNVRGSTLASPVAAVMFLTFVAIWFLDGLSSLPAREMLAPVFRAIGLTVFAGAVALWISGWRRAHLELDQRD